MEDEEAADKARKFIEATGLAKDGAEWLNGFDDEERQNVFNAVEVLWQMLHQNSDLADRHDTMGIAEDLGDIVYNYMR